MHPRRLVAAVGAAALCCVAALLVVQGSTQGWHAAVMLQLQQLVNWNSGVLGGKASLVTQCAHGNDAACDALVNDPGAVAALQHIDAKNPNGFTHKHPHKAATLQRKFEISHPSHFYRQPPAAAARRVPEPLAYYKKNHQAVHKQTLRIIKEPQQQMQAAPHRVPEPLSYYKKNREARKEAAREHEDAFDRAFGKLHAAKRVTEPLSYYGKGFEGVEKNYKTALSTKKEWHLPAWKDGALGGGNTQWLKACAEGNYFACNKVEKNNDDVHDVLLPQHKIRAAVKKVESVPQPVYVTHPKKGVWGALMSAIGLGDSYYTNSEVLHSVPKMQPDSGLDAKGHTKVYNDGTVGFLSDQ